MNLAIYAVGALLFAAPIIRLIVSNTWDEAGQSGRIGPVVALGLALFGVAFQFLTTMQQSYVAYCTLCAGLVYAVHYAVSPLAKPPSGSGQDNLSKRSVGI